jgi:hypothetical protein
LTESKLWKWLYNRKQSTCSCNAHQNSNDTLHGDKRINHKVHMETNKPKTRLQIAKKFWAKRAKLEVLQYLTDELYLQIDLI